MKRARSRRRDSGQALVESALTLPLLVFMVLGTLQLFMMLHARIMTQYAAYKAVRAGSLVSSSRSIRSTSDSVARRRS